MSNLRFEMSDLLPIIKHAQESNEHRPCFGQQAPIPPALWLVHDQGVYLMSNGAPVQRKDAEQKNDHLLVAYAKGMNPNIGEFDDWYEAARAAVGGDDFCEPLPLSWFVEARDKGACAITLKFGARSISATLIFPRAKKAA